MIKVEEILSTLSPNQKVNYDKVFQKMASTWQEAGLRPNILMHVCCAPCSTYTLEYLTQYADVTIYFVNSNIHPKAEYQRRAAVTAQFVKEFNQKTGQSVGYLEADYSPQEFFKKTQHLANEPEGGDRCKVCYDYRLDKTAEKAVELGFDYFGSALTISPHKNSQTINAVGIEVQKLFDTQYLPSDFKKNGGYQRSVQMCEEYDIYRQCYCGCVYGANAQGVNLVQVKKEALEFLKTHRDYSHIPFKVLYKN
ncbi:TPA: epoxyqueuosine reductase QueH [Streptococcus suis]|nr:epoxyqueuosine reductase QueH [Streptococcus suis]